MAVYIYGLVCPVEQVVRYVGKSVNPRNRLKSHISAAINRAYEHHTARWIRRLADDGLRPEVVVLHEILPGECWQDVERSFIASAVERGWRLTNSTAGGEGLDYIEPEDEARYRANLKRAMDAYNATPAGRERLMKMVAAALEPEALARRNLAIRTANARPDVFARHSAASKEVNARPEVKASRSRTGKRNWETPAYRDAKLAHLKSEDFRAEQSARLKSRWQDDAARKKMNDARWTPERRQQQAERIAAYNAGRRIGK